MLKRFTHIFFCLQEICFLHSNEPILGNTKKHKIRTIQQLHFTTISFRPGKTAVFTKVDAQIIFILARLQGVHHVGG